MFTLLCENYFINIRLLILFKKKKTFTHPSYQKNIKQEGSHAKVVFHILHVVHKTSSTRTPI